VSMFDHYPDCLTNFLKCISVLHDSIYGMALMGKTSFTNITYIFSVTAFLKCTSVYMTACGIYLKTFDFAVSN